MERTVAIHPETVIASPRCTISLIVKLRIHVPNSSIERRDVPQIDVVAGLTLAGSEGLAVGGKGDGVEGAARTEGDGAKPPAGQLPNFQQTAVSRAGQV